MNRPLVRALTGAALLGSLLLSTAAAPLLASCAMPIPIEEAMKSADSVFVGTVTGLSNGDRWATVAVDDVWSGPDLAPVVEVRGGPGGNTASSIDRSFSRGTRYLFVVSIADGQLSDNACSATTEVTDDHVKFRPAAARQPVSPATQPAETAPFDPASLLLPGALIVAAGVFVFGAVFVLRRRA